jgi:hypothetical protein
MFVGKYSDGPLDVTFAYKNGTLTIIKNVNFVGKFQVIAYFSTFISIFNIKRNTNYLSYNLVTVVKGQLNKKQWISFLRKMY